MKKGRAEVRSPARVYLLMSSRQTNFISGKAHDLRNE